MLVAVLHVTFRIAISLTSNITEWIFKSGDVADQKKAQLSNTAIFKSTAADGKSKFSWFHIPLKILEKKLSQQTWKCYSLWHARQKISFKITENWNRLLNEYRV